MHRNPDFVSICLPVVNGGRAKITAKAPNVTSLLGFHLPLLGCESSTRVPLLRTLPPPGPAEPSLLDEVRKEAHFLRLNDSFAPALQAAVQDGMALVALQSDDSDLAHWKLGSPNCFVEYAHSDIPATY